MSDVRTRTTRSDEGILSLTNAVFTDIFGLSEETTSRILKIIRNQGQWQDLKISIRQMSGVSHRRLNDVINMAQQNKKLSLDPEIDADNKENDLEHPEEYNMDPEWRHHTEQTDGERLNASFTFAGYLLNEELQYTSADLRDPGKKQEIMRLMRADDNQANQLQQRAEREQKQIRRKQIAQEQDPRRANLMRQKQRLQQQLQRIEAELQQGQQLQNQETQ